MATFKEYVQGKIEDARRRSPLQPGARPGLAPDVRKEVPLPEAPTPTTTAPVEAPTKPFQFKHGGMVPGVKHYDRKAK